MILSNMQKALSNGGGPSSTFLLGLLQHLFSLFKGERSLRFRRNVIKSPAILNKKKGYADFCPIIVMTHPPLCSPFVLLSEPF